MAALATAFVRIRPDTRGFRREAEEGLKGAGTPAGEKFGEEFTRGADGRLRDSRGKFVKTGETIGESVAKGFSGGFGDGGGVFLRTAATMAARLTIVTAAAAAAAPAVAKFTAALAPAAGAAVVLPAALLAINAASATVKVAVMGVGEAISAGYGDNAEKAAESLDKLSGATRSFAQQVINLRPQVTALQKSVSNRFFLPLADEVQSLARLYIPMLEKRMGNLAGSTGGLAEEFAVAARRTSTFSAVTSLLRETDIAVIRLRASVVPLTTAFAALIRQTAPMLPGLAAGFSDMATNVSRFVIEAAKAGRIKEVFENAKETLATLGGILRNIGSIFGAVMDAANANSADLLTNLLNLTATIAAFLRSAQGGDALTALFASLAQLGAALRSALGAALPAIADAVKELAPALAALAGPASDIVVALAPLLPIVAGVAAAVITQVTPALTVLARWLAENETATKVLVATIGTFIVAARLSAFAAGVQAAGGIAAWTASTVRASVVGRAFTAVQYGLGVAMRFALGPIGLVITAIAALVAGIVWAYRNNEDFRAGVQRIWTAIRAAVAAVVDWFRGTALPWLTAVWNGIAAGAKNMWENVIRPALAALVAFFVAEVAPRAIWLWRNVIQPAFQGIASAIRNAWNNLIKPVMNALIVIIRDVVAPVVMFLWRNVIQPAFNAISRIIQAAWAVIRLIFAAWVAYLQNVIFPVIRFLWNNVISPVFNGIKNTISTVWNSGIKPIFSALGNFIRDTVAPAFSRGVEAIRSAWDSVREAARKPVAFVVNQIINPLIGGFNKMANVFGTPKIDPIAGFESGGRIPGVASPVDNRIATVMSAGRRALGNIKVATGEFITNARSTAENLPWLEWANSGGRFSELFGQRRNVRGVDTARDGLGYADGGLIGGFMDKVSNGFAGLGDFVSDPIGGLKKAFDKVMGQIPGSGTIITLLKNMAGKVFQGAKNLLGGNTSGGIGGVIGRGLSGALGKWPPSPAAQRGDSGVWRRIVALIKSSGIRQGSFGNGYRPGDPKWHGSGRAVDWMGYNMDALAGWLARLRPLELIHRTRNRDYAYTRGVNKGSFNEALMNAHRNHIHIAMRRGGLIGRAVMDALGRSAPVRLLDRGGSWPSGTLGLNASGHNETVLTGGPNGDMAELRDLLAGILAAVRALGPEVAAALERPTRRAVQLGRSGANTMGA